MANYIEQLYADRIGGSNFGKDTAVYKFEKIKRAKKKALKDFPDRALLDFGVGEPDKRPADAICNELAEWALKLNKHGYTDTGTDPFREAIVSYMFSVFSVNGLSADLNILPTIGSKEALAAIPRAFINKGDIALMTTPGYPVLGTNTIYSGGEVYNLPLLPENNFFPDLEAIPEDIVKRAKILYLNYPNNPTGKCATISFFEKVVEFAHKNNIIIVHDAPYITIVYDREPLSILSIPGAMDTAIELHSFSKSYSMTGWRLGFAAGNPGLISALAHIKDNTDSGSFEAIQKAGIYALNHFEENKKIIDLYKRRLVLLVKTLSELGFNAEMPEGTFYLYVSIPSAVEEKTPSGKKIKHDFPDAAGFSQFLIERFGIVTVPWDDNNTPFIRFSATFTAVDGDDEIRQMGELRNRLKDLRFLN